MIFDGEKIKPYVNVFLNGKNVLDLDGLETGLIVNDEVAIFPLCREDDVSKHANADIAKELFLRAVRPLMELRFCQ